MRAVTFAHFLPGVGPETFPIVVAIGNLIERITHVDQAITPFAQFGHRRIEADLFDARRRRQTRQRPGWHFGNQRIDQR